jgi:hypothetical protein
MGAVERLHGLVCMAQDRAYAPTRRCVCVPSIQQAHRKKIYNIFLSIIFICCHLFLLRVPGCPPPNHAPPTAHPAPVQVPPPACHSLWAALRPLSISSSCSGEWMPWGGGPRTPLHPQVGMLTQGWGNQLLPPSLPPPPLLLPPLPLLLPPPLLLRGRRWCWRQGRGLPPWQC